MRIKSDECLPGCASSFQCNSGECVQRSAVSLYLWLFFSVRCDNFESGLGG
uniref:Uncharacterized protein n=1 Tax=Ciona intestinalis TaxID=7719 RepID=H2XYG1_CIOIN